MLIRSNKEDKKEKKYLMAYNKICNEIENEDIIGRELYIIWDEILPDLYVNIPVKGNRYISNVDYDIYAFKIKRVKIKFPNGKSEVYNIDRVIEKEVDDGMYCCTWEEPMIKVNWNGLMMDVSLIDLLKMDNVKIFIDDYNLDRRFL